MFREVEPLMILACSSAQAVSTHGGRSDSDRQWAAKCAYGQCREVRQATDTRIMSWTHSESALSARGGCRMCLSRGVHTHSVHGGTTRYMKRSAVSSLLGRRSSRLVGSAVACAVGWRVKICCKCNQGFPPSPPPAMWHRLCSGTSSIV